MSRGPTAGMLGRRLRLARPPYADPTPHEALVAVGGESDAYRLVTTMLRDAAAVRRARRMLADLEPAHHVSGLDDAQVARALARHVASGRLRVLAAPVRLWTVELEGEDAFESAPASVPEDWTLLVTLDVDEPPAMVSRLEAEPDGTRGLRTVAQAEAPQQRMRSRAEVEPDRRGLRSRAGVEQ